MENNYNYNANSPQAVTPIVVKTTPAFKMDKKDNIFLTFLLLFTIPFVVLTLWGGFNLGFTLSFVIFICAFSIYFGKPQGAFRLYPFICLVFSFLGAAVFTVTAQPWVRFWLAVLVFALSFIWFAFLGGYDISDDRFIISVCFTATFGNMFASFGRSMKTLFSIKGGKGILKVLLSILCAFPVLILVVNLLRSGDAAFEGLLDYISESFGSTGELLRKIITGILIFPFLLSFCLGLKKNRRALRKTSVRKGIENVYIISFLSVFSVVYIIYLFSQLAYFFSAFGGILPKGITVAAYARRGFFEMTVIAAINFVLIALASFLCRKKENGKRNAVLTVLITFIGVFTLLLIATAVSKMILYIDSFGMTRLRILTSAFMIFLAVLFIAVILRGFIKKMPVIKTGLIAACVILLILGFADVDKTVAEYNLYAYESGYTEGLDIEAIGDLGEGGIPTLYKIYQNKALEYELRIQAREELNYAAERMYSVNYVEGKKRYEREREIGDFNLSSHKAYKVLDEYLDIE